MVPGIGVEPTSSGFSDQRSDRLSYPGICTVSRETIWWTWLESNQLPRVDFVLHSTMLHAHVYIIASIPLFVQLQTAAVRLHSGVIFLRCFFMREPPVEAIAHRSFWYASVDNAFQNIGSGCLFNDLTQFWAICAVCWYLI